MIIINYYVDNAIYCSIDALHKTKLTTTLYMHLTDKVQESLEEYRYTDKNCKPDIVQIAIKEKRVSITAVIDFKSVEQYTNFVCPVWLLSYNS